MWIKLLSPQTIDVNGAPRRYYPGDWVNIGRQYALFLVHEGVAEIPGPKYSEEIFGGDCGIVVWGGGEWLGETPALLRVVYAAAPRLQFDRTVLIHGLTRLSPGWIASGIGVLDIWQLAAPLMDYSILAQSVGDDEDRRKTCEVIHDLRVPVYDIRCLYVRRCDDTERLLSAWESESGDRALAFLRALYHVKPFVLALPPTWVE